MASSGDPTLARPGGVDGSGADAVGPHAIFGLLQGHAHSEGVQKGLAAAIRGEARRTVNARFGAGAGNFTASFLQVRQGELGHEEGGAEIVPQGAVEILNTVIVGLGIEQ